MTFQYHFTGPSSFPLKQNINNNQTSAIMGIPFKPATMTQGNDFAAARFAYIKDVGNPAIATPSAFIGTYGKSKKKFNNSAGEQIYLKKINAVGKSSTNSKKINPNSLMSFAGPDNTSVKSSLAKCRGGGCIAPKKKGGV
jgi:hypothetical protein